MANSSQSLVLGTAYGYEVKDVFAFVESLRLYYAGDAALLVASSSSRLFFQYLESQRITPVFFDSAPWMIPHMLFSRFIRYAEFLRACQSPYGRVLLSDVSDVIIQADPFQGAPNCELLCFLEAAGRPISSCQDNRFWIESLYGPGMMLRLGNCDIVCSGTIMGSAAGIVNYVDQLVGQVRPNQFLRLTGSWGHEQGILNVLVHTNALPNALVMPNGNHVFTMGFVPDTDFQCHDGRILFTKTGQLCPIVHQYNHKPAALKEVQTRFPVPPEFQVPLLKGDIGGHWS